MTGGEIAAAVQTARRRDEYQGYSRRADEWGRGLVGSTRAVFWGSLGQYAFAKWVSAAIGIVVAPDDGDMRWGDGGVDFIVAGYRVQLKTAGSDYDSLLVRTHEVNTGKADVYVRAHWAPRRLRKRDPGLFGADERNARVVDLCGWAYRLDVQRHGEICPGKGGTFFNYALPPERLRKMCAFAAVCRARLNKGA